MTLLTILHHLRLTYSPLTQEFLMMLLEFDMTSYVGNEADDGTVI